MVEHYKSKVAWRSTGAAQCSEGYREESATQFYNFIYEIEAFQSNWYSNLYEISRIEAYEMDLYYSIFA